MKVPPVALRQYFKSTFFAAGSGLTPITLSKVGHLVKGQFFYMKKTGR